MKPAIILIFTLLPLAQGQDLSPKGVNLYSVEREAAIGRQTAAGLRRSLPLVNDPRLDSYVSSLAAALSTAAGPQVAYTFTIYEDVTPLPFPVPLAMPADALLGPATEPVALPGGPIFIPLSLLSRAASEGEFAFQLAHAMAHVVLRHGTKRATRESILAIGDTVVPTVQNASMAGMALNQARQIGMDMAGVTFARAFEREADFAATGMIADAGYDPEPVAHWLESQPPVSSDPAVFIPHPTPANRAAGVRAAMAKLPPREYRSSTGQFEEMRALAAQSHGKM